MQHLQQAKSRDFKKKLNYKLLRFNSLRNMQHLQQVKNELLQKIL